MNHLKQCSSPQAVWCSLMLFFPFTLGMASIRPPPQSEVRLPKTSLVLEGLLGKGCRESTVDLSPPPCSRSLPSSLAERQITEFLPHWHCQALTVVFICIVLVVNWFKCYGNDIYLFFFDPVNSKQAGLFFLPSWGMKDLKMCYKYEQQEKKINRCPKGSCLVLKSNF